MVGKHARDHLVDAHLGRDGTCRALGIAGEHDGAHAERVKARDGRCARLLGGIGGGDEAEQEAVEGEEERGLGLVGEALSRSFERGCVHASLGHEQRVARKRLRIVHDGGEAHARDLAEPLDHGTVIAARSCGICVCDDG